jgi:hypothetical protein
MMPSVPEQRLADGGWTLAEEESRTRFELPTLRVVGHTRLYEDAAMREVVRETIGIDQRWRFFFATRLAFEPPLAPGIGPTMVYGTVASEAKREFETDLGNRGFENVARGRGQRVRTETGDRASLTKYGAQYPLQGIEDGGTEKTDSLAVTGWLGVWSHEGSFRLAGGAYPDRPLATVFELDEVNDERLGGDTRAYRDELLDLIRAVA